MRREESKRKKQNIANRLTLIIVTVVFVLGMMLSPAGTYAVGPDGIGAEGQPADVVETTESAEPEAEQIPEEAASESQEMEAAETAAEAEDTSIDEVVEELNDAVTVDLDTIDESEYDGFIYKLTDDTSKQEIKEMESAIDDLDGNEGQEVAEVISRELYTADSIETIAEVADPSMVEYIEPDYILRATETNDKYYEEYGWYLEMIHSPYAWDMDLFGSGVTVAVLDSGVYSGHEDFESDTFTKPYNVLAETSDVTDNFGHGTAVTGVIAAAYNNGKGLTGVMPEASIMPVKVLDDEGASTSSKVIIGINYAVNNGASVINMSMGTTKKDVSLETACNNAAARGAILVAASGNEARKTVNGVQNPVEYPAAFDSVVSVGSVNEAGAHSSYSTYNDKVAVTAPGEDVFLLNIPSSGYKYKTHSGTSYSSPQVAAMAAMIKQLDPSVNYEGFMRIIAATSNDKGAEGRDPYYGYGVMDLEKACRYMMEEDITTYDASLSAASFVYDGKVKTPSVTVKKANKALPAGSYTTTYAPGRTAVGTYKVTITGKDRYTGTKSLSFKIVPPLVKSIKAPQRAKSKLTVRWKSMSKSQKKKYKNIITGYQVRVATSSNFSNAKYVKVKGIAKTKAAVKKLKRKTTYYVQYRSYKTVGSATYYSKWSSKKKAKTK